MDTAELERLRKEREEEHRKDLEALDRVFRMFNPGRQSPPADPVPPAVANGQSSAANPKTASPADAGQVAENPAPIKRKRKKKNLLTTIKELVATMPGEQITVASVYELLKKRGSSVQKGSIKGAVAALAKEGILAKTADQSGPRPAIYKLNESTRR